MKLNIMKEITRKCLASKICAELKKPVLRGGELTEDPDMEKCLLPDKALLKYFLFESRHLVWDKEETDLAESKEEEGERIYVGQR